MTLVGFSVTSVKFHYKLLSAYFLLIIILLKQAGRAQVGKIKLFINFLHNRTSICTTENRKTNQGKQPAIDCSRKPMYELSIRAIEYMQSISLIKSMVWYWI